MALLRFFVDHLSDDTCRLFHRGFRFGTMGFGQSLFCKLQQFSVSFVIYDRVDQTTPVKPAPNAQTCFRCALKIREVECPAKQP